jgi:hypothetical protein
MADMRALNYHFHCSLCRVPMMGTPAALNSTPLVEDCADCHALGQLSNGTRGLDDKGRCSACILRIAAASCTGAEVLDSVPVEDNPSYRVFLLPATQQPLGELARANREADQPMHTGTLELISQIRERWIQQRTEVAAAAAAAAAAQAACAIALAIQGSAAALQYRIANPMQPPASTQPLETLPTLDVIDCMTVAQCGIAVLPSYMDVPQEQRVRWGRVCTEIWGRANVSHAVIEARERSLATAKAALAAARQNGGGAGRGGSGGSGGGCRHSPGPCKTGGHNSSLKWSL